MSKKKEFKPFLAIFIYLLATIFLIYEMALQVSPSIMTKQLMIAFGIDAKRLGIMASFYFYSYTLMQIPVGILYDYYGPRLLISLSLLICASGALFFGMTNSLYLAALGRFCMGIGSAFAFIGVLVVAIHWFPSHYFAFLVGVAQLLAAFGALGGELPLAALVNQFGWRTIMTLSGIIGILIALLCAFIIRDHPTSRTIKKPKHHIWKDLKKILHSSQTLWIALYAFSSWGPITVFAALWGVPYLMLKYQISNIYAAFACGMIWVGLGLMSPLFGWLSDRLGRRCILLTISSCLGLIGSIFAIYVPGIPFWLVSIFLFMMGLASAGQILTFALVKDTNKRSVIATAIGFNNMAVVIGGALFQPLVGYILDLLWTGQSKGGIPIYSIQNYQIGLIIVPFCFLIAMVISLFFIRETYCQSQ